MADGSNPELKGNTQQGQWRQGSAENRQPTLSRRKFLVGSAAVALVAAAEAFGLRHKVTEAVAHIPEALSSKPTEAQVEADNLLQSIPEDQWVEGTVRRSIVIDKVIPAKLRDKPSTFVATSGEPDHRTGRIVGEAEPGQTFRGIVVEGNNPLIPNSHSAHSSWLYTNPEPGNPAKGRFIHEGNFEDNPKMIEAKPINLQSVQ